MGAKFVALISVLYCCAHVDITMAAPVESGGPAGPSTPDASKPWTWNELLGAKGAFPENLDKVKTTSKEAGPVVDELKALLGNQENFNTIYGNYKKTFQKSTDGSRDDAVHGGIFKQNLIEIAQHNVEAEAGKHSWWKGVNQFTDMNEKELSHSTGGVSAPGKK